MYDVAAAKRTETARYPYQTRFGAKIPNGPVIRTPLPLYPKAAYTSGTDRFYIGYPSRWTVDAFSQDGKRLKSLNSVLSNAALTRAARKIWADSVTGTVPGDRQGADGFVNSLRYPENLPAFDVMVADDVGNVWVRQFVEPGAPTAHWLIFDRAAMQVAKITMPSGLRVLQVGRDFLVGLSGGKDANEEVTVFKLTRN